MIRQSQDNPKTVEMRWTTWFGRLVEIRGWISRSMATPTLGERGERAAARYLRRKGYTIVSRRERSPRSGELDLVAVDGRTVVFVEVKTRRGLDTGHPAEAVHREKQRRLTRSALSYLKRHDLLRCRARFDVVAVVWPVGQRRPTIEHFANAFEPVGHGQMFS